METEFKMYILDYDIQSQTSLAHLSLAERRLMLRQLGKNLPYPLYKLNNYNTVEDLMTFKRGTKFLDSTGKLYHFAYEKHYKPRLKYFRIIKRRLLPDVNKYILEFDGIAGKYPVDLQDGVVSRTHGEFVAPRRSNLLPVLRRTVHIDADGIIQ
jgi:hypothetical protein